MGLIADIYRGPYGDCSNGGISSHARTVLIVNVDGPTDPKLIKPDRDGRETPLVALIRGAYTGIVRIVPCELTDDGEGFVVTSKPGIGPMMGGCYVATSDSRFTEAVEKLTGARFYGAVPLHDRYESQADYDANFD